MLSHVQLFATPWIVACQAPLPMGFHRQEYWTGLPFPSPGDLPNPGIKLGSPALQADSLLNEPPRKPKTSNLFVALVEINTNIYIYICIYIYIYIYLFILYMYIYLFYVCVCVCVCVCILEYAKQIT